MTIKGKIMLKKILFLLWPPYEAWVADSAIAKRNSKSAESARWEAILNDLRNVIPNNAIMQELEDNAKTILDFELKRKETIENKASSIFSAGIAIAIFSIVPALFADTWKIPITWAVISGTLYMIAVLSLLVSVYYAVKVRRVKGFVLPCAESFIVSLKNDQWQIRERIVARIATSKWNEDLITQKTNYLSVAEDLFLRGLAFIAVAVIVSIAAKLII